MDHSDPLFPTLPGWRFSLTETSANVYRAEGRHIDGRSVSRIGTEGELIASLETLSRTHETSLRGVMPRGPKGEKRPADVIGNLKHYLILT